MKKLSSLGRSFLWKRLIVVLLLLYSPLTFSAELNLIIDRAEISIDEAFQLSISSRSTTSGDIDLAPLQQDFEILDQSKQSSVRIINGSMSQSTTWMYSLVAKREGKITIPAIHVGNDATKARDIVVKGSAVQGGSQDIIVEAEIEQTSAYVQGQFIYVQRLLSAKPYRNNSTLTAPRLQQGRADVESLGRTPEEVVKRKGRDYTMITLRFAVIPQESGKIVFEPTVFSGTLRRSSQNLSNSFGFSARGRRVRVRSNEVSIDIKPRPSEFTGKDWIVAKNFSLHLSWPTPADQIEAGKPISVVLAAIADGLRAEQLPDIKLQPPAGIKLYPEKPSFNNERNLEGIVGTMNKRIVLVSTGGGNFEIPELHIPWWNSETNQQEMATLEAVKLTISGDPAPIKMVKETKQPSTDKALLKEQLETEKASISTTLLIAMMFVTLLLLSLLGWLLMHYKTKQPFVNKDATDIDTPAKKQQILKCLQQACHSNNATEAQQQLQQWMHSLGLSPKADIPPDSVLQQQMIKLNHALYAEVKKDWQGQRLWQAVSTYQMQLESSLAMDKKPKQQTLEPLYHNG
jgi:hypothetical protein